MNPKQHPNNILILFAHPALQKSRVNRRLIKYINNIDGVTFHDLYEAYPDFHILIENEQKLLLQHDIVVFHHPVFWFNMPAILREWQDHVLVYGWAYGKKGTALQGKRLLSVISTGGKEAMYSSNGYHRYTIKEFLRPIEQMAYMCGMDYLPPFVIHGTHKITEEKIIKHGEDLRKFLTALRDNQIDFDAARGLSRLNSDIDNIIMK